MRPQRDADGGNATLNEAPPRLSDRPGETVAPWSAAIFATMERPRPVPPGFVDANGTKRFARASDERPDPLSSAVK